MKVLITGSEGFVGSETQRYFHSQGIDVFKYDLMLGYDIRDPVQFYKVCEEWKPNVVLHLAAIARFSDADRDPKLAQEINVLGTKNVSEVCQKLHIPLVFSSTGSVYMPILRAPPITEDFEARGNSIYGCSKLLAEKYVQENTPYIILRYAHLYGKEKRGHGLVGGYWDRIKRGLKPKLMGGRQSNDFSYVKDIAKANYLAVTASWDKWQQIYNIGTGEEISAKDAGEILCDVLGWKEGVEEMDARLVDAERFVYDITKARVWLGFNPDYNFRRGIEDMFIDEIKEKQKKAN
jgi:nucleoside-diphosphate-sugar epimerase